jgi:putative membrane protein
VDDRAALLTRIFHAPKALNCKTFNLKGENFHARFRLNVAAAPVSGIRSGGGMQSREIEPMKGLLVRWLVLTVSILLAAYLIEGIRVSGFFSAFMAAAILGILNAFFRPILFILTLPINLLTLGLFTFIINAVMVMMASGVISGFEVASFWSALGGSLLISIVSWLLNSFVNERGTIQVIDLRHRGGNRWE